MRKLVFQLAVLHVCLFYSLQVLAYEAGDDSKSQIIRVLKKWPQDFNEKNVREVCELFAPDVIASYPGTPDRNYDGMCQKFNTALNDPDKTFRYDAPEIEQVIIQDELAVVRLIWTLHVSDKNKTMLETVREKGMDVFKRQPDGSWKIIISYAYPESTV